ncbi:MAG: pantoate--beta-alanine ligase [bacterium]|nr:pantoate--beta-alanine ligase [bacterium]
MKIVKTIQDMQQLSKRVIHNKSIGLVPTMGYLHNGHLSLIHRARKDCDIVVMSIFVNPMQFAPGEDFKKYPRDFDTDRKLAERAGVDVVFYPDTKHIYAKGFSTVISVENMDKIWEGKTRPAHFRGVCTIVGKLFNIVDPDIAYFGQKDAQQVAIIKRMVRDLNFNVKIVVVPTVREKDGLAMSSRNKYLSSKERKAALVLYRSLREAEGMIKNGEKKSDNVLECMRSVIKKERLAYLDYVGIVNPEDFSHVSEISKTSLIIIACRIGETRLIDNFLLI